MAGDPGFSNPLLDALRQLPGEIFAVVEGAHFDDAPAELKARGLTGRPLYVEGEKDEDVASGPHLVRVRNLYALEKLLTMIGDKPAAVFWSWQQGAKRYIGICEASIWSRFPTRTAALRAPLHTTPWFSATPTQT